MKHILTLLFLLAGLAGMAQEKKEVFQISPENNLIRFRINNGWSDWYRLTKPTVQPQDTAGMPAPCKEAIRLRAIYGDNLDAHYSLPSDSKRVPGTGFYSVNAVYRPVRGVIESLERQCAEKGGKK